MVDDATDALYTISRTTGRATRVGSATRFGLSVLNALPTGLAWDGKYLLMLTPSTLYILNKTTGVATRFVDDEVPIPTGVHPNTFGSTIYSASGLAAHDRRLFMVDSNRDALYVLDRSRGAASLVGNLRTERSARINNPSGLSMVGSDLYVSSTNPNALYKINRASGTATSSKAINLDTVTGIAWDGSKLYAVDDSTDAVYTIRGIQAPAVTSYPFEDRDAYPYLPDLGDLYFNGIVNYPGATRSIVQLPNPRAFVDSVFQWNSPQWARPGGRGTACSRSIVNCSTYEHDLEISANWMESACTTWSTLPDPYDDCPTAGYLEENPDEIVISFGTFKAPDIEPAKVYYGSWSFIPGQTLAETTVRLLGQEGYYRNLSITLPGFGNRQGLRIVVCPRKTILCILGIGSGTTRHQRDLIGGKWNRGAKFYGTFDR